MNQVFDFKRWLLLIGKHWSENRKRYLLSLVAMASLMILWYAFMMLIEFQKPYPLEMQVSTYYIGMSIVGCLFGSMLFNDVASGPRAMHYLSVPASTLEKLLSALFYGIVLFFVCYTVIFYLVDYTMIQIGNNVLEKYWQRHDPSHEWTRMTVANMYSMPVGAAEGIPNIFFYFLVMYINLQSAFILGSVYFPGYSFIKTVIVLLVVILLVIFYVGKVLDSFMPAGSFYEGFFAYRVWEGDNSIARGVRLPDWLATTFIYLFMYGFLPLLWFATYFRLKEKEV
jgi:hypothetical protein